MIMWAHRRPSTAIVSIVLLLIALAHLVRLFSKASVMVNTVAIPVWVSFLGLIITVVLAIWLWMENKRE